MNVSDALGIGNGGSLDDALATSKGTVNVMGQSQLTAASIAVGDDAGGYGLFSIADSASVSTPSVQNDGTITQSGGPAQLGTVDGAAGAINSTGGKLSASYIRQHTLGVSSGATVAIAPNGTTTGTSVLAALSIDSASTVDLSNNDLILDHASGDNTALDDQNRDPSGVRWRQVGPAGPDQQHGRGQSGYGLAYAEASDLGVSSFGGQSVSTAVLVKYTLNGDLNLTGTVDQSDIAKLAPNYGQAVSKGWSQGDVNGDGAVDQMTLP